MRRTISRTPSRLRNARLPRADGNGEDAVTLFDPIARLVQQFRDSAAAAKEAGRRYEAHQSIASARQCYAESQAHTADANALEAAFPPERRDK
jgi:hypothetical protein